MHTAVRHNRVECIRVPVAQLDTDTEVTDASGLTPLPLARKYWKTLQKSEVLFLSICMILLAIQGGSVV